MTDIENDIYFMYNNSEQTHDPLSNLKLIENDIYFMYNNSEQTHDPLSNLNIYTSSSLQIRLWFKFCLWAEHETRNSKPAGILFHTA